MRQGRLWPRTTSLCLISMRTRCPAAYVGFHAKQLRLCAPVSVCVHRSFGKAARLRLPTPLLSGSLHLEMHLRLELGARPLPLPSLSSHIAHVRVRWPVPFACSCSFGMHVL